MPSSDPIEKNSLHDWIEEETRGLDVVASWETLCDVYRTLGFQDPLSDETKLEEFKWIIAEMNKHLTRARNKLLSCRDMQATRQELTKMFQSPDAKVTNRMDLTYHKLKQLWVNQMLSQLDMMMETVREEDENGRPDFWND